MHRRWPAGRIRAMVVEGSVDDLCHCWAQRVATEKAAEQKNRSHANCTLKSEGKNQSALETPWFLSILTPGAFLSPGLAWYKSTWSILCHSVNNNNINILVHMPTKTVYIYYYIMIIVCLKWRIPKCRMATHQSSSNKILRPQMKVVESRTHPDHSGTHCWSQSRKHTTYLRLS